MTNGRLPAPHWLHLSSLEGLLLADDDKLVGHDSTYFGPRSAGRRGGDSIPRRKTASATADSGVLSETVASPTAAAAAAAAPPPPMRHYATAGQSSRHATVGWPARRAVSEASPRPGPSLPETGAASQRRLQWIPGNRAAHLVAAVNLIWPGCRSDDTRCQRQHVGRRSRLTAWNGLRHATTPAPGNGPGISPRTRRPAV